MKTSVPTTIANRSDNGDRGNIDAFFCTFGVVRGLGVVPFTGDRVVRPSTAPLTISVRIKDELSTSCFCVWVCFKP